MLRRTFLTSAAVLLTCAAPIWAEGLCNADPGKALATLSGDWQRDGAVSVINEVTDMLRPSGDYLVRFEDGTLQSPFLEGVTGGPLVLVPVAAMGQGYDVDRVDDMLETTERADIADTLSDTLCGPEALPQWQAKLDVEAGIAVSGTVTVIGYFEDRMLQISELELRSEDTILFMTETALLTPAGSGE